MAGANLAGSCGAEVEAMARVSNKVGVARALKLTVLHFGNSCCPVNHAVNQLIPWLGVRDEEVRARPIVTAYGAGKFSPTLKPPWPMPTTRLQQELERHFLVVLVDEHRTSSSHYETATRLRDIYRMSDGRYVRGVLWCDATNTFGYMPFTHRDAHAAMNSRWCLYSGAASPLHLRRGHPKLRGEPAVWIPR
jgi:hypothetical protein